MTLNRALTFAGEKTLDQQHAQLRHWAEGQLARVFMLPELDDSGISYVWAEVAGDASQRCYYRITSGKKTAIVMNSANDLESVAEFMRITGIFQQAGIRVPQLYSANLDEGYLLLEDFGDQMLKAQLSPDKGDALFEKVLPTLLALIGCDSSELATYSREKLDSELMLFDEWYLQQHRQYYLSSDERQIWSELKSVLLESALASSRIADVRLVHSRSDSRGSALAMNASAFSLARPARSGILWAIPL